MTLEEFMENRASSDEEFYAMEKDLRDNPDVDPDEWYRKTPKFVNGDAPYGMHKTDELRCARLGWNCILTRYSSLHPESEEGIQLKGLLDEMNKNGLFDKPGEVLQGPIKGDPDNVRDEQHV